jgi:hypothetical protein
MLVSNLEEVKGLKGLEGPPELKYVAIALNA